MEQLLRDGVSVRFAVRGGSMAPIILHREIVIVAPVADRPLETGDIVLVASGSEGLMVHRIIAIRGDGHGTRIITKGDATQIPDQPVSRADVLGRVIQIEKTCGQ